MSQDQYSNNEATPSKSFESLKSVKTLTGLRVISLTEGVSYLLLLFIAMPLKYGMGMDMAVKIVGWAHGVLFIALALAVLINWVWKRIDFKLAVLVMVAGLIPFGAIWIDRWLKQVELASHKQTPA